MTLLVVVLAVLQIAGIAYIVLRLVMVEKLLKRAMQEEESETAPLLRRPKKKIENRIHKHTRAVRRAGDP